MVGCSKVRALSKYKFILTYQTSVQRDEALKNQDLLVKWFHEVNNWDIYEACDSRRLWIEVFGVPAHGWSLKNFEKIVSLWGKLICLETLIDETVCFDSLRILIECKSFQEVMGNIILQIGDAGYRIMVKEASCSINLNPMFIAPESGFLNVVSCMEEGPRQPLIHEEEATVPGDANKVVSANSKGVEQVSSPPSKDRNSIPGAGEFVSLGDEVAVGADVDHCLEDELAREEDKESPGIQINSNLFRDVERSSGSPGANSLAYSRTPTACFSHSDCPEKVTRNTIKLGALKGSEGNKEPFSQEGESLSRNGGFNECQRSVGGQSKGLKGDALGFEEVLSQHSNDSQPFPPGFEPRLPLESVRCDEFEVEDITKVKESSVRLECSRKNHIICSGKRVTRSQSRMCKEVTGSKKSIRNRGVSDSEGRNESPSGSSSVKTTESMRKMAVESLELGELLGVKVVANKENAIKRITQSLKSARVPKSNHKTV